MVNGGQLTRRCFRLTDLCVLVLACSLLTPCASRALEGEGPADVEAEAATYYIAPDGSDDNPGTLEKPFATFTHAIDRAGPGDTIFVRGGTYMLTERVLVEKAGREGAPIRLYAMPGEAPVLDFSRNPIRSHPAGDYSLMRREAIGITFAQGADYWHVKGLTVQSAPFLGFTISSSHNVVEQLTLRWHQGCGLCLGDGASYNLVLNCDSYENFDPQRNGEDADGFAPKFERLGPGNVLRDCRAWGNSDDGYDLWHASQPVLIEDCWAFDNGFELPGWREQFQLPDQPFRGDGNGFKLGQDAAEMVLNRVAAFGNRAFGIDENGNRSANGVTVRNATLVNNARDGIHFQISLKDGRPHTVVNTVAFDVAGRDLTRFDRATKDINNSWDPGTGVTVTAADFVNLDMARLLADAKGPRKPDGSLPEIGLRLAPGSDLVDAGIDVGLPYEGKAPDLGAFELHR